MLTCLAGLLAMFFLIRLFNFHSHDTVASANNLTSIRKAARVCMPMCGTCAQTRHAERPISWIGLCIGLD
jgi:hypothetical protein